MTRLAAVIIGVMSMIFLSALAWGAGINPNKTDWGEAENLALNKPVNVPEEGVDQMVANGAWGPKEKATDADRNSVNWMGWDAVGLDREEIGWCEVDLEEIMWIDTMRIWHYYDDDRTYHDVKLAVSRTGAFDGEEVVIFDGEDDPGRTESWIADVMNDDDADFEEFGGGEYQETPGGRLDHFIPVEARYIRDWVYGSTSNASVHWVEIEAYSFLGAASVSSSGKLATLWGNVKSE